MVDVPRQVRLALFPKFLSRGVVLRVQRYPLLVTEPKDKYVIPLNREFRATTPIYHVLTTSRTQGIPFPALTVVIPVGTLNFFRLETAITCREVHAMRHEDLAERYADGTVEFVGTLPTGVMERIDEILTRSIYIPPKVAREILLPRDPE